MIIATTSAFTAHKARTSIILRHEQQQQNHVKMNAEIGVLHLQAKEYQRLPTIDQKAGEWHGSDSSSQLSEGTKPADTLISDL